MSKREFQVPRHVAIIMDGNGRWARQRRLPRLEGHRQGVKAVRETVTAARKLGVGVLTLYCFSKENWARPRREISGLMNLLRRFLKEETQEMLDNDIRLAMLGDESDLTPAVRKSLDECRQATDHCQTMQLNLALSYGGRDEIIRAARRWARELVQDRRDPDTLSEESFSAYLDTGALPEPDLLIRTAGEMRVSNFLLWQIAYTEFYVTDVLWPDFRESHLIEAFEAYSNRERRFGALGHKKSARDGRRETS